MDQTTVQRNDQRIEQIEKFIEIKENKSYKTPAGKTLTVTPKTFIPILYVGGRRCGKTTIMASVYVNAISAAAAGNLKIFACDSVKAQELSEAIVSLENQAKGGASRLPGIEANSAVSVYDFIVYDTKDTVSEACVMLRFIDVPGEIYDETIISDADKVKLAEIMDKIKIMLVAVDAVSLMESKETDENYYDYNLVTSLEGIFRNLKPATERKLFSFIPVKCEKYCYNGNNPTDMIDKIESKYSKIIQSIKASSPSHVIAFTPVQTVGTLIFSRYDAPEKEGQTEPQRFIRNTELFNRLHGKTYAPLFCDQVLWYVFRFIYADAGVSYKPPKANFFNTIFNNLMNALRNLIDNFTKSYQSLSIIRKYNIGVSLLNSTRTLSDENYKKLKNRNTVSGIVGNRLADGYKIYSDEDGLFDDNK